MRAKNLTAALLVMACLLVTGCAVGGQNTAGLVLYNDKGAWSPYFDQLGALAKKQIGVTMTPSGYTDSATYQATIRSSFQTDVKPDLFSWSTGPQLVDLVERRQLADTTDIWTKAIAAGEMNPAVKQYFTVNGRQYCVPMAGSYWGMFYNKKVFAQYGLKPPRTWDDMMALAATLKSHGIAPFYQTTTLFSFVWFQQLLAGSDPVLYRKLALGQAKYTDPGVVAVMKRYRDMAKKGYFSDSGSKLDPGAFLKSGKVAMVPDGTWFGATLALAGQKPGVDYDYFTIPNVNPALPKTSVLYEAGAMCAPANANKLGESKKLMAWWLTQAAQRPWSSVRNDVSTNPKVPTSSPNLNAVTQQAATGGYVLLNRYYDITPAPILTMAIDSFGAVMVNPDDYPNQLRTIQKSADDHWRSQALREKADS